MKLFPILLLNWVVMVVVTLSLSNKHDIDVEDAYQRGAVDAAVLINKTSKDDQAKLALQWWTDSTDMKEIRKKLCTSKINFK